MSLTPEQKQAVISWVAAGDNLSAVQQKLRDQFQLSLTYRDVRFLVDDLDLTLKDAAPKVDTTDLTKAPSPAAKAAGAEKKGFLDKAKEKLGLGKADAPADEDLPPEDEYPEDAAEEFPPAGNGGVTVEIDKVTLIPGALASGTVTFSDGVTGKWIVDHQGRPGFTQISQPGYRPSAADAQSFMQELSRAFQSRGM